MLRQDSARPLLVAPGEDGIEARVATEQSEAALVVDDRQTIVRWSYAAAMLLGIPAEVAVGQPCYKVIRGRTRFGKEACKPNCAAFSALRSRHVTGRCSLLAPSADGAFKKRILCELVALPKFPGGAVATLSERPAGPTNPTPDGALGPASWASWGSPESVLREMTALATLSSSLQSDGLPQSIEQALDWLRDVGEVEAAELYLVEPQGGDAVLSAFRGPFRTAFSQVTRFQHGEGFPGLVLSRGEPIVTRNLLEDPRYLRTRVKEKDFHTYACVPLGGSRGIIGVLGVANRRPIVDLARILRLLTWASRPISSVLETGLLRAQEDVAATSVEILRATEHDFDDHLRTVLRQMALIGGATGGALLLYDRTVKGPVRRVTQGEFTDSFCPIIWLGDQQSCPAIGGGHGIALDGPRQRWPSPCRQASAGAPTVCCVPLVAWGEAVGMVHLRYSERVPSPPARYLGALLAAAERASPAIWQVWTSLQNQVRAKSLPSAVTQRRSPGAADRKDLLRRLIQEDDNPDSRPMLEVRCFGTFELLLRGKLVTREMFPRRGALTLLKILLIHDGRPMPRDALTELLWPEADPKVAANRLYVLVHTLRRVVEPTTRDQRWTLVCSDGDRYYLNPESPCRLDIKEFREYVNLGQRLEREGDTTAAMDAYEAAASLYRGDLLEEEPFADWCWGEREHLREICLTILSRLAAFYLELDAPDKSIERYRHALRIDPLREENHRGLMRALLAAGRRDEALREYRVCGDILRRELDVEPLPETARLYSLIRNNGGS